MFLPIMFLQLIERKNLLNKLKLLTFVSKGFSLKSSEKVVSIGFFSEPNEWLPNQSSSFFILELVFCDLSLNRWSIRELSAFFDPNLNIVSNRVFISKYFCFTICFAEYLKRECLQLYQNYIQFHQMSVQYRNHFQM